MAGEPNPALFRFLEDFTAEGLARVLTTEGFTREEADWWVPGRVVYPNVTVWEVLALVNAYTATYADARVVSRRTTRKAGAEWWMYGIFPIDAAGLIQAGFTPNTYMAFVELMTPPLSTGGSTPLLLKQLALRAGTGWPELGLSREDVIDYLHAGITADEAAAVWEPKRAAGEDVASALAALVALQGRAAFRRPPLSGAVS